MSAPTPITALQVKARLLVAEMDGLPEVESMTVGSLSTGEPLVTLNLAGNSRDAVHRWIAHLGASEPAAVSPAPAVRGRVQYEAWISGSPLLPGWQVWVYAWVAPERVEPVVLPAEDQPAADRIRAAAAAAVLAVDEQPAEVQR